MLTGTCPPAPWLRQKCRTP